MKTPVQRWLTREQVRFENSSDDFSRAEENNRKNNLLSQT